MTKGEGLIDQKEKSAVHLAASFGRLEPTETERVVSRNDSGSTNSHGKADTRTETLQRPRCLPLLAQLFAFSHFSELISQKLPTYRQLALLNVVVLRRSISPINASAHELCRRVLAAVCNDKR